MREDTVVQLRQPGTFSEDPLTEVLRRGARRLLAQAVEREVTTFVEMQADLTDEVGRLGVLPRATRQHRHILVERLGSEFDSLRQGQVGVEHRC